jgi:hypothetical protein
MLAIASSGNVVAHTPVRTQADYIPLTNDDDDYDEDVQYHIDTTRSSVSAADPLDTHCPDTLDEMLMVVRKLRCIRTDEMNSNFSPSQVHTPAGYQTPARHERQIAKDNANNFTAVSKDDYN